jgi:hypothetical protein
MSFSVEGTTNSYARVKRLAHRMNFDTNIEESVVETLDGKKIWLTVAGDEDQISPFGILRGWYVAKPPDNESAAFIVTALAGFGQT